MATASTAAASSPLARQKCANTSERRERPAHRRLAELAAGYQALADAHRLVDLIGAPPPARARHEYDQTKGVRAEVDDRQPLTWLHRLSVFPLSDLAAREHRARAGVRGTPSTRDARRSQTPVVPSTFSRGDRLLGTGGALVDDRQADARRRSQQLIADIDAVRVDHTRERAGDDLETLLVDVRRQQREALLAQAPEQVRLAHPAKERA